MTGQLDLIPGGHPEPEGFQYRPELITAEDEAALLEEVRRLPFHPFEFHGHIGKRQVISFGWKYDFLRRRIQETLPVPDFLLPIRALAGLFAGIDPMRLEQILVTEYQPGAGIGWHRDRKEFGDVVGVSLSGSCPFRFRRNRGKDWDRYTTQLEPRSVYLLRGPSRTTWEHSIEAVPELRYSLTFRTLATS